MNQPKGKLVSSYIGKLYEFVLPDGKRKLVTVGRKEGMKEARAKLATEQDQKAIA